MVTASVTRMLPDLGVEVGIFLLDSLEELGIRLWFLEVSSQMRAVIFLVRSFPVSGLVVACLALAACETRPALAEFGGTTMGTTYSIKVADPPPSFDPEGLHTEIDTLLRRINDQMSTYIKDSELSHFNARRETDWLDASPELVAVVLQAQSVSELTGGAFDVTVGPLVNLWGFGPCPAVPRRAWTPARSPTG